MKLCAINLCYYNPCWLFNLVSSQIGSRLQVSLSVPLLGLNSVILPLIWLLRLDYQGLAQDCCKLAMIYPPAQAY